MIEGIPLSVADLSGWGAFVVLAFLVLVSVIRGWFVPGRSVDDARALATTWQKAWEVAMTANQEKDAQLGELLENSRTSAHALEEIQAAIRSGGRS